MVDWRPMSKADDKLVGWVNSRPQGPLRHSLDGIIALVGAAVIDPPGSSSALPGLLRSLRSLRSQYDGAMKEYENYGEPGVPSSDLARLFGVSEQYIRRLLRNSGLVVSPSGGRGEPMRFDRMKATDFLRRKLSREPYFPRQAG